MKVKVAQSCPTLCEHMDYTVHGILEARILEWVAYLFSRESSWPRNWTGVSIAGGLFTSWAMREAPKYQFNVYYINCYVESKLIVKIISMIIILSRRLYIFRDHFA